MYPPFNLNDILGPMLAMKLLLGAGFISCVFVIYKAYLQKQDEDIG